MNKILFLDIDGVLNCNDYYVRGTRDAPHPLSEICPLAIDHLNKIVAETGCNIVISSTWRHSGVDYCINVLKECGFTGMVLGITPHLREEWAERGNEIYKYLLDHKLYKFNSYEVIDHDYAILDDDIDMLYMQKDNFFHCHPKTGLTEEIANNVIQFLNFKIN